MKKLIFTTLTVSLFITLPGCKRKIKLKEKAPSISNVTKIGRYIKKTDLSFNDVTYKKLLDDALNKIIDAKDYDEFYEAYYSIVVKTNEMTKKYTISDALRYLDPYNSDYIDAYNTLSNSRYDYIEFYNRLIYEISDNREYLDLLFPGYSKEDLDYIINLATKRLDERYITLKKEITDIENEADKADSPNEMLELLYQFVTKNKELANVLGFDSYIEYQDLEYNRSYTKTDVSDFISNVKEYIVPLMDENGYYIDINKKLSNMSKGEYNYFIELNSSTVFDKDYYTLNLLKDYSKRIGRSYYTTFNDFLNDGNYIFAGNNTSVDIGYTNTYFSFFGLNEQDAFTVAHEFGHYYSDQNMILSTKSLDLREFFSQANEYLFINYLQSGAKGKIKNVYDVSLDNRLQIACKTMVLASALREFEEKIYTTTLTSKEDLKTIWDEINNTNYNGKLGSYWQIEIRYNLYYISYATSVTGAIGLYSVAKDNLDTAINSYIKAANNKNMDDDIDKVLENANLYSPFSKDAFIKIVELVEEKR